MTGEEISGARLSEVAKQERPERPGATIEDRATGETVTFLETADETGGARVVMRLELAPGTLVPSHAHPFAETFECLEGRLEFEIDGQKVELAPPDTVHAPPDHVHGMRNMLATPAVVRVTGTPGAEAEFGLRVKFLLSRDGFLPRPGGGPPKHLLLGAVVLDRGQLYFPPLPRWLFRSLIHLLATVGRWRGRERFLRAHYPEYERYLAALSDGRATKGLFESQAK